MNTTNLSDTWARRAMQTTKPLRAPVKESEPSPLNSDEIRRTVKEAKEKGWIRSNNGTLTADEIRQTVELGKRSGLMASPGVALPVEKNGTDVSSNKGVRSQWMDVSPGMAARWLKNNFRNRPMKEDVVKAYARDMASGSWVATHQGIAFNNKDELIDGQHRLSAIVMAKVTVRMMVTFGLPSQVDGKQMTTMDCVDRGATRSVADQLAIQHGMKNGRIIAAICASIGAICFQERTRRLSVGQTLEIYHEFQAAIDFCIQHRSKEGGIKSAGVMAAFAFAMTGFHADRVKGFYRALVNGDSTCEPIEQLLAFLVSDEATLFSRSMDRGIAELCLHAIYLAVTGKRVQKLVMTDDGAKHFRGIQPERVTRVSALFALPE